MKTEKTSVLGVDNRTTVPKVIRQRLNTDDSSVLKWEHYGSHWHLRSRLRLLLRLEIPFAIVLSESETNFKKQHPEEWKKSHEAHRKMLKEHDMEWLLDSEAEENDESKTTED